MMEDVQMIECPHCRIDIKRGANVCAGCRAEISYGTPRWVSILCFMATSYVAYYLTGWLSDFLAFTGMVDGGLKGLWGIGILLVVSGILSLFVHALFLSHVFRDRVWFERRMNQ